MKSSRCHLFLYHKLDLIWKIKHQTRHGVNGKDFVRVITQKLHAYESSEDWSCCNLWYPSLSGSWITFSNTTVSGLLNSSEICSIVFPFVSGTLLYMKIKKMNRRTTNGRKEYCLINNSCNNKKCKEFNAFIWTLNKDLTINSELVTQSKIDRYIDIDTPLFDHWYIM